DGGNNDFSFYKPDLLITIADPHRAGHEISYYPGEMNVRAADVVIINKVNTADKKDIETVHKNVKKINPSAQIIDGISTVFAEDENKITGRALVIEDGPTVTHGGMSYGAGTVVAREYDAVDIIDPRRFAVGSIAETFQKYPHLKHVLPAMGYGKQQTKELEETINNADCDIVVSGTPIDLSRIIRVNKPIVRVRYDVGESTLKELKEIVDRFLKKKINN
ncbi:CobW/HypB/UreG, nucleotide-binding domain protein, partial [Thermoplasmatales archaeon SCGC AB-539-C06]